MIKTEKADFKLKEVISRMLGRFRAYLDAFYPDFTDTERKYDKWSFLKEKPYV